MNEYRKKVAKSDADFWARMSDLDDSLMMIHFRAKKGIKRDFKRLMKDELKVASIEL